jgi:uncharacterized protein (TIGR03437 family)
MERNRQLVNLHQDFRWDVSTQAHGQTATPSLGVPADCCSAWMLGRFRWCVGLLSLIWLLGLAGTAQAQIQILAVVNSASYQAGIPEPGSLATIFCSGLKGIAGIVSSSTQSPLPLQIAGVEVTVNLGSAPLLAVADLGGGMQLINLQVPPERLLTQMSTVQVMQNGSSGKADNVDYPGVGGLFSDGQGNAIALHVADGSIVTPQNPAQAGEFIAALGTGFGPTYQPKPIGFPAPAAPPFQGLMDFTEPNATYNIDMPARQVSLESVVHVSFSGVAAGFTGVDQVIFQVPKGLSPGTHSLVLAAGVISCLPPPLPKPCSFLARANSNVVKIPVR